MAAPWPPVINPATPQILSPGNGDISVSGIVQVYWNETLSDVYPQSYYVLQYDDSLSFTGPTTVYKYVFQGDSSTHHTVTLTEGTWYFRVKSVVKIPSNPPGYFDTYESGWSTVIYIVVDYDAVEGGNQAAELIKDNKNKYVPVIYGTFDRNESDAILSNGLCVGYLKKFLPDLVYTFAAHGVGDVTALFVPSPNTDDVPLKIKEFSVARHSNDWTDIIWHPTDENYYGSEMLFDLSTKELGLPFITTLYGGNLWVAQNPVNVIDQNINTKSGLRRVSGPHSVPNGRVWFCGACWEINDPEHLLPKIFTSRTTSELWVEYTNLVKNYSLEPFKTLQHSWEFRLVNWANGTVSAYEQLDQYNSFTTFDKIKFSPTTQLAGPLRADALTTSTNRFFALYVDVTLRTASDYTPPTIVGYISDLRLKFRQRYEFDELLNADIAYIGGQGRQYGKRYGEDYNWLSAFNGYYGIPNYLYNAYVIANQKLTIEDPAMIIADLLLNYTPSGSMSISDFDCNSFASAVTVKLPFRIDVTDESTTIQDVNDKICQQTPFQSFIAAAGKAKLINLRTFYPYYTGTNASVATIYYQDIDVSSFEVSKTSVDDVVNTIEVKSRYHKETDTWLDTDTFINSASVAKYGTKKMKDTMEFEYINSGTGKRDNYNNSSTPLYMNPVKYQIVHLIEPDLCNGQLDPYHQYDDGWWANQHNQITVKLPGMKFRSLEEGDRITIDNDSFSNYKMLCNNESWTGKQFIITEFREDSKGITITAIQAPTYSSVGALRGLGGLFHA